MDAKFKISKDSVMKDINVITTPETVDDLKEPKKSKVSSLLDACYKTNFLDESSDFIECDFKNNLKIGPKKCEKFICEICKTDITDLSVDNRELHVNNCIDKQISSQSEVQPSQDKNVVMLGCPFCSKQFPSPEVQSNHIKKCGKTKGLNTQNIIQALELEKRYALERISLGLPAKPVKPVKPQKNVTSKTVKKILVEPKSKAESDIQLAKALSLSLAKESTSVSPLKLNPPTSHQRPGKKNKSGVTPLLVLRSEEDRRRLLLQKVATIMEPANTLDIFSKNSEGNSESGFSSEKVKEDFDKVSVLWNLSSKSTEKSDYYVEELLSWVNPSEIEAGAKLCHLSQIAGHEIVTQLPCDYTFSPLEVEDGSLNIEPTQMKSFCITESLRSIVASPWMSDTDIHTSCGTVIPAHRLLLALRCPLLKQDSNFCSGEKRNVLKWDTISFDAALQFLNFIYTGKVDVKENIFHDLSFLAKKYEVMDLQFILKSFQTQNSFTEVKADEPACSTSCFQQKVISLTPSDSTIRNNEDLEIVCDFLNTDLQPSPYQCSQLSTSVVNSQNEIILSKLNFNTNQSDIKNTDESFVLTKNNPYSLDKNEVESNTSLESTLRYSRKFEEVEYNTKSEGSVEVLKPSEELYANSFKDSIIVPEKDDVENSDSQDSVKVIDPNLFPYSDLNRNKKNALQEGDLYDTENKDSDKFSKSCSLSSKVSSKEMDARNRENQGSKKFSDMNLFASSNLYEGSETKLKEFEVHCTENKDWDKLLEPNFTSFSSNLHQDLKFYTKPPSDPYEDGIIFKKPAVEMHDMDVFQSKARTETKNFDLADGSILQFSKPLESISVTKNFEQGSDSILQFSTFLEGKKSVSAKDLPSSPRAMFSETKPFEQADDSILQFSKSLEGKFVSTKDIPSSPRPMCSETHNFDLASDSILKFYNSSQNKSVPAKDCPSSPVIFDVDDSSSDSNISENSEALSNCKNLNFVKKNTDIIIEKEPDGLLEINCPSFDNLNQSPEKIQDPSIFKSSQTKIVSNGVSSHSQNKHLFISNDLEGSDKILDGKKARNKPIDKNVDSQAKFQLSTSPITPLPDYKKMMTPEIKQALRKIGVKALPRKKAITLLSHIYNETHPLLDSDGNPSSPPHCSQKTATIKETKKRKCLNENVKPPTKKQKENNTQETSQESDDSSSENPEWLGCVPEISFSQFSQDSPTKINKDVIEAVKQYIQSSENIYNNILNYKPLNMVDFHHELKDNGIKISIQKLMDFLDEQCITFSCPRKEEFRNKQNARTQRFRKKMIVKLSQQTN